MGSRASFFVESKTFLLESKQGQQPRSNESTAYLLFLFAFIFRLEEPANFVSFLHPHLSRHIANIQIYSNCFVFSLDLSLGSGRFRGGG